MIRNIVVLVIALGITAPVVAGNPQQPEGLGTVQWGASREDIVAVEGRPDIMGDVNSTMWYLGRSVMGKPAEIVYNFEKGCTDSVSSVCRFSDGYYSFKDGSKAYSDELEKTLTEQYGQPGSTTSEVEGGNSASFLAKGKKELQHTMTVRRAGKVRIVHTYTVNLHGYTNFTGETHKAGPAGNRLHYYGPYHHEQSVKAEGISQQE